MTMERMLEPVDIVNASQIAYERLREIILAHRLKPGQQLHVKEVALQLGISTTPVNQALARLAEDGLVKILPRRGTFVTALTPDEMRQLVEARVATDTFAGRLAVQRATDEEISVLHPIFDAWRTELETLREGDTMPRAFHLVELDMQFHRTLVAMSRNRFLIETVERLLAQVLALVRGKFWMIVPEYQRLALAGHTAMLEALTRRDEDALALAVRDHLWDTYHIQIEMMRRVAEEDTK